MTKRADNNVAHSRNKIPAPVPSRARVPPVSSSPRCLLTENKTASGPTMIGGARSAKSPRDQAYIYFACFEGRAAGGCRERRRGRGRETRRRTGEKTGGREGPRAPQQCGIWRVLVPSNSTRCSSAAGCIISRSLARSRAQPSYRVVVPLPSTPSTPSPPLCPARARALHFASEKALPFFAPLPPFPPSLSGFFLLRPPLRFVAPPPPPPPPPLPAPPSPLGRSPLARGASFRAFRPSDLTRFESEGIAISSNLDATHVLLLAHPWLAFSSPLPPPPFPRSCALRVPLSSSLVCRGDKIHNGSADTSRDTSR